MYSEVAWVLVSSGTEVQPQIILDTGYLPDYLSISYDYGGTCEEVSCKHDIINNTKVATKMYLFCVEVTNFMLKISSISDFSFLIINYKLQVERF